jgi:inner membrane protein
MTRQLTSPRQGAGEIQDLTEEICPVSRKISNRGFTAERAVPFIVRGVRAEGPGDSITGLDTTALGISFIEVADRYQSVSRSLKLRTALPGIGLAFLLHL